jgi:hypothetical protein
LWHETDVPEHRADVRCRRESGHRQQVIDSINSGANTFYTRVNGKRADIAVVNGPNGPFVRTHADGVWNDNLLALAECA